MTRWCPSLESLYSLLPLGIFRTTFLNQFLQINVDVFQLNMMIVGKRTMSIPVVIETIPFRVQRRLGVLLMDPASTIDDA